MRTRRQILGAALLAPSLAGCGIVFGAWELRYRLTIQLLRDGREYAGTGVLRTRWTSNGAFAGFDGIDKYDVATWGDAVIIDAAQLGPIFGLLRAPALHNGQAFNAIRPEYPLQRALREETSEGERAPSFHTAEWFASARVMTGVHEMREAHWPVLLRFRDTTDPTTAELLPPESGIAVRRVTIEVTSDPVTRGIESLLPWLGALRTPGYPNLAGAQGGFDRASVATQLDSRAFILSGDEYL
jgi:hypothetical protein